ncbi:hypothetical protein SUGI_0207900 [Cryptomeria japonica]|nr:hypothetical protein SUGI_0207900 [Cryptomeria japonica]
MIVADARAVSFSFSSFTPNMDEMNYLGDAFTSRGAIQLTRNLINEPLNSSVGRAVYNQPVRLASTFTTHFKFLITNATDGSFGDGLAFFIAAAGARLNLTSTGGWLGLTDWATDGNSSNQIVAVEFDTFQNEWDPPSDHIGFDVNSIRSVVNKTLPGQSALRRGGKIDAWVDYHAGHLSVFLSSDGLRNETADLYYDIDLRDFLPEWVTVGFAASTGDSTEIHNLLSWEFSMSDPTPAMRNGLRGPVLAPAIAIPVLSLVGMLLAFLYGRWYSFSQVNLDIDVELDGRLAYGPRPFRYKELCLATRGFADKLGQGGFGSVYYGMLPETKLAVAVKRVAQDSEQVSYSPLLLCVSFEVSPILLNMFDSLLYCFLCIYNI